jgi:hypothetical protein
MRFPLISVGNSNNMILGASKTAVLGFGKRGVGKHGESKAQGLLAERTAAQILAITVPLATAVTSIAWAIAVYLMVRERYRAQVEMARFAAEASGQGTISETSPVLAPGDRSLSEQSAP